MRSPLRGYAQIAVIACMVAPWLAGCVIVPLPPPLIEASISTDPRQSSAARLPSLINVAPHYDPALVKALSSAINKADSRIEIVSATDYWRNALRQESLWRVSLSELLADDAVQRARNAGICAVVVVSARMNVRQEPFHYPDLTGRVDESSAMSFMIIPLAHVGARDAYVAKSTSMAVIFAYPFLIGTDPDTEGAVIKAAAAKTAEGVTMRCTDESFRVVVLAERNPYWEPGSELDRLLARAEAGHPDAQYEIYSRFRADNPSWSHAWLCKAADQGYVFALYRLGVLNQEGLEGLQADPVRAYVWYQLAAKNASPDVAAKLKPVTESLAASLAKTGRLRDAKSRVDQWRPGQCAETMEKLETDH